LIEINLLPKEMYQQKDTNWRKLLPLALCLVTLSIGIGVSVAHWWQINQYRQQIQQIESNLKSVNYLTKDFAQWEEAKKKIQLQEQWKQELNKEKIFLGFLLEETADAVPQDAWLTKISFHGGAVTIEGLGFSYQSLVVFLTNLREKNYFQGEPAITNSQATSLENGETSSLISFVINGELAVQRGKSQ